MRCLPASRPVNFGGACAPAAGWACALGEGPCLRPGTESVIGDLDLRRAGMASSAASGSEPSRSAYPGASSVSSPWPASATSTSERPNPEGPAQDTPGDPPRPADGPPGALAAAGRSRSAPDRLSL